MDQHVDRAITRGFARRGVDVLRVQDDGHDRADDEVILDRAAALGRVVFTQDQDFLAIAQARQLNGTPFAGVVYAEQLAVPVGKCVLDLEVLAKVYDPVDMANKVEYLPL